MSLSTFNSPGAAKLSGTITKFVSNGTANFTDLSIDIIKTGYKLLATAWVNTSTDPIDPLNPIPVPFLRTVNSTSQPFDVYLGSTMRIYFPNLPPTMRGGTATNSSEPVIVYLVDNGGNIVTVDVSSTVTLSLATNPGGATFTPVTVTVNKGIATFTGLTINPAASGYQWFASVSLDVNIDGSPMYGYFLPPSPLNATSQPFTVQVGEPASIAYDTQVPSFQIPNWPLDTVVYCTIRDAGGNIVRRNGDTMWARMTLVQDSSLPLGSQIIGGSVSVPFVNGSAIFDNVRISLPGLSELAVVRLNVTTTSPQGNTTGLPFGIFAISQPFQMKYGIPIDVFNPTVVKQTVAGFKFSPQPILHIVDIAYNLILTDSSTVVDLTLWNCDPGPDSNPISIVPGLFGTARQTAVKGIVTFTDLLVKPAGLYRLKFSVTPRFSDPYANFSAPFNITIGTPVQLALETPIVTSRANETFPNPVVLLLQDFVGNTIVSDSTSIASVTVASPGIQYVSWPRQYFPTSINPPPTKATLMGTLSKTFTRGVAVFADLTIDRAAIGYTLRFFWNTTVGFPRRGLSVDSQVFDVDFGPPVRLVFDQLTKGASRNVPWPLQPVISLRDRGNNIIAIDSGNLTVQIASVTNTSVPWEATISGNKTIPSAFGQFVYKDLSVTIISRITLLFTYNGTFEENRFSPLEVYTDNTTGLLLSRAPPSNDTRAVSFSILHSNFSINEPIPSGLRFKIQPGWGVATRFWTADPVVELLDEVDDVIIEDNLTTINLYIQEIPKPYVPPPPIDPFNPPPPDPPSQPYFPPNLYGAVNIRLDRGVARFPGLSTQKVGNFTLVAWANIPRIGFKNLTKMSQRFEIYLGPAVKMQFAPYINIGGHPGQVWVNERQPIIDFYDAGDNIVFTESDTNVTIVLYTKPNATEIDLYILEVNPWIAKYRAAARAKGDMFSFPLTNGTGQLYGTTTKQAKAGRVTYRDISIDLAGKNYSFFAYQTPRYFTGQFNEAWDLTATQIGNGSLMLSNYTCFSPFFNVDPIQEDEPPHIAFTGTVSGLTQGLVWLSNIMGPTVTVVSSAVISLQVFSLGQTFGASTFNFGTNFYLYVVFMQLFMAVLDNNSELDAVLGLFESQKTFVGHTTTDGVLGYAASIGPKMVFLLIIIILFRTLPGFYFQTCCNAFTLYPSFFIPIFMMMIVPMSISLASLYKNPQYIAILTFCECFIWFIWIIWIVRRQFRETPFMKRFIPEGRGYNGIFFRPTPEHAEMALQNSVYGLIDEEDYDLQLKKLGLVEEQKEKIRKEAKRDGKEVPNLTNVTVDNAPAVDLPFFPWMARHEKEASKPPTVSDAIEAQPRSRSAVARAQLLNYWEEFKLNLSRIRWRFGIYPPRSKYLVDLKKKNENRLREKIQRHAIMGMIRNPQYEEYAEQKKRWAEWFYRPFFEETVVYTRKPPPSEGMCARCIFRVRRRIAPYFAMLLPMMLVTYIGVAVAMSSKEQVAACIGILVLWMLFVVAVVPYRNPFLQKGLVFFAGLIAMLTLLLAILVSYSLSVLVVAIAAIQLALVPFTIWIMFNFKELPEKEPPEFIKDTDRAATAESALIPMDYSFNFEKLKPTEADLATDDSASDYYCRVGKVYWDMRGDYRTDRRYCYAYFAQSVKMNDSNAEALAYLGHYYRIVANDANKAKKFYRASLKADPCNYQAGHALANMYLKENKYETVESIYDAAILANPDRATWVLERRKKEYASGLALQKSKRNPVSSELLAERKRKKKEQDLAASPSTAALNKKGMTSSSSKYVIDDDEKVPEEGEEKQVETRPRRKITRKIARGRDNSAEVEGMSISAAKNPNAPQQ